MTLMPTNRLELAYCSFLVRLWQDSIDGPWRVSARSVHTGEVTCFASLEDFYDFMQIYVGQVSPTARTDSRIEEKLIREPDQHPRPLPTRDSRYPDAPIVRTGHTTG